MLIDDVWTVVFSFLPSKEFCSVMCVSIHFHKLAQNVRYEIELHGTHLNREGLKQFISSSPNVTSIVLKNFNNEDVIGMLPNTIQQLEIRTCSNMMLDLSFPNLKALKCENSSSVTLKHIPHTLTELII